MTMRTIQPAGGQRSFREAADRWAAVGPYYAMFPVHFADMVVKEYSSRGDVVLDPFAGRGTAVFSATTNGRTGLGIEINPVGWIYSSTKLNPAPMERVLKRLSQLDYLGSAFREQAEALPEFFHWCFSLKVRAFLVAARHYLRWKTSQLDRTVMAFLLIYLHGKRGAALSNQMRQTKAMSPPYSIKWWRERRMLPPEVEPVPFLNKRVLWRYACGVPNPNDSRVYLGDSLRCLSNVQGHIERSSLCKPRLLLTSPPYWKLTNYHYDQWLRLWLLGGPSDAIRINGDSHGKFEGQAKFRWLLLGVFRGVSRMLDNHAIIYVRTDYRKFTLSTTIETLRETFPAHKLVTKEQPYRGGTQTTLFAQNSGVGEVDIILTPS